MSRSRKPARVIRALAIGAVIHALAAVDVIWAADPQKQILVLYSTRRDAQIAIVGDRELPLLLERSLAQDVDYYSEFIDTARFVQSGYQAGFRDFLRLKYSGKQFDLVVAMGDIPLAFAAANREVLFTGSPLVFFANRPPDVRPADSTGITAELDLRRTIDLASQLQPDLRHIFVVLGANVVEGPMDRLARSQFKSLETRFEITYLAGLATRDLESRLASLPPRSMVYYLVVDRDGANQNFHPLDYLDRVTRVANAPVYCWVDSAMGHGIVGGSLKDQLEQTRAIAAVSLKVLQGQRADTNPITSVDLNISQVDWRQLRRWGIPESVVPAGTLVKFREPSAWDRYKAAILTAAAVLIAQTLLIAGLLVQHARRRQAEEQVRGSQAELQKSYVRIRDLGARLLDAQEGERARIARELHDDVSQQMAVLEIDLGLLRQALTDEDAAVADEALRRARGVAKSVHDLSHRLHPAKLRLIGLVSALNGLQRELSQPDLSIRFTHQNVPSTISPEVTLCVFRVVQEALQNATKYSRARHISVDLAGTPIGLEFTVADDGIGFDVEGAWGKGLGLISISERLEAIGGTFEVRSTPGAGTRLEFSVPIRAVQGTDGVAV